MISSITNSTGSFAGGSTPRAPLVSVIIIFLNAEQFIEEAIDSVFAQSYSNWELLAVDDGSTDGSTAIVQSYAERYPGKVCYLEHPGHQNRGMSASRNRGIADASGEYIAFLDADDVWLSHKLEQQVALLESLPEAGMVFGPTEWWYSWNHNSAGSLQDFTHGLGLHPDTLLEPPELLTRFLSDESISPCTCSVLLRRKTVNAVGGFEESFNGLYEDQAFFAKVCLAAPVFASQACVAKYRQHKNSNCSVAQDNGCYAAARAGFLNWLAAYLSSQNYQHAEVSRALEHEIRLAQRARRNGLYQRARQGLPGRLYRAGLGLKLRWRSLPIIRQLRCLQLRRLQPLDNGRQRGTPIVRYHWDRFLHQHKSDIRGTVLEIGTTVTVRKYGGTNVVWADALDLAAHSPEITLVDDLSRADNVASDHYDCFVNQFTIHLIYDVEAALYHSIRILKPGGVLLINFPCVDYYFERGLDMGTGDPLFMYWWFTPIQVENHLRRAGIAEGNYSLTCYGNPFTRVAYQMNLPAEDLTRRELDYVDPGHPLLICARVVKPSDWRAVKPDCKTPWRPRVTPARWNHETGHYAT